MKRLGTIFLQGLATILPIIVTVYALRWLGTTAGEVMEPLFNSIVDGLRGEGAHESIRYRAWMGIALAAVIVFAIGLLVRGYLIRRILRRVEGILAKIPLVKTLYGSVRDLMGFFAGSESARTGGQVVTLSVGEHGPRVIGLVTREDFSDIPAGIGDQDTIAVYVPMSYQLGGFTLMVPRSAVEAVDMNVEAAMRFAVTAGMKAEV
jgi:uncharacterized membrane protein